MAKTRKKLTQEEKLAKDRLRKREKYAEIKNNPELYSLQKEKERKRYLSRKEKKKICSIKEMTPRAQREQRRRWRKNSLNYLKKKGQQKKIQKILVENSPPDSDLENDNNPNPQQSDPLTLTESETKLDLNVETISVKSHKNVIRRLRYKHMKILKKLKDKICKLNREKEVLRKKSNKYNNICDSIEKKVNEIVTEIRPGKKEEVKKQLLFSETITRDLRENYKITPKRDKKKIIKTLIKDDQKLRKYKLLNKLPFNRRKNIKLEEKKQTLINTIHSFFEEDTNSRIAAGKREFIKRRGEKKQKRYLNDNLRNLHEKFLKEKFCLSYSTFCKYRPFWVVFPKDRNTCQCKLHTNVDLLVKALKSSKIITESTGTDVIKSLCCDLKQECIDRTCLICANRTLTYHEFENDKKIKYFQWVVEKRPFTLSSGIQKNKIVTIKKKIEDYPREIIYKLESILNRFLMHNLNIIVQYNSIKKLKENLKYKDILIHVDFSENYCLKYNQEIQSFHFGGSREQVCLHTGVLYYRDSDEGVLKTKSFCTMSNCLKHDAGAIWAHLCPVLKMANALVPFEVVHFLSDSPFSQYRNKYMFYMITKLKPLNPNIKTVTWNYQESGHGKGAPDGIGAVVKRTADNCVKYGTDVGSFEDFVSLTMDNIRNVHFDIVTEDDIADKKFPPNIPGFRGTMQVHQALWTTNNPKIVTLRRLSCFECQDSIICIHNKHLGTLNSSYYGDEETKEKSGFQSDKDATYVNNSSEIFNNLHNPNVLETLKPLAGPIDLQLSPMIKATSSKVLNSPSPKVTILSDVRYTWENRKFYIPPKRLLTTFNSAQQRKNEKVINSNKSEKQKNYNKHFDESDSDDSDDFNIF